MAESVPTWTEIRDACKRALYEILQNGQSVGLGGRTLTMANLEEIRSTLREAEQEIAKEKTEAAGDTPARNRLIYVTPTE